MLEVRKLAVAPLQSNCYLVWDEESNEGVVIDPGGEGERIVAEIERIGFTPKYILNTHCHGDHLAANDVVRKRFGVPLLVPKGEVALLDDPGLNMSVVYGLPVTSGPADSLLEPGSSIEFGGHKLEAISTAGHSPDGMSLYGHGLLFSGDALFKGSVGRTDFPGCDEDRLISSIRNNLLTLPEETIVYPGHGPDTTIGIEKRHNPFLI